MKNAWTQSSNKFTLTEVSKQTQVLPSGVYKFELDMFENPFLSRVQDNFVFPYKVYGIETDFINRVCKSWHNTTGNFGVLLNGLKGTGKTVTAEIIANELNLPVIIVSFHSEKLVSFLNDIQQDVIVFVDEFEKIYDGYENTLLTIMDGALKTKHRIFFLLTTNDLIVDRNLLQRPSRVRYVKSFSDLTLPVIMEIVNDKLEHKHLYDAVVNFISQLPIITMDLVKSIIEEVNIHDEDPSIFKEVFNIHGDRSDLYNVYKIVDGNKEEVEKLAMVRPYHINTYSLGEDFRVNNQSLGYISQVISSNQFVVVKYTKNNETKETVQEQAMYFIEPSTRMHRAFTGKEI
jgi:PII-like signaling protein